MSNSDVLSAMEHTGDQLVGEAIDRGTSLDSKAMSILGWTSAIAAVFLTRGQEVSQLPVWALIVGSGAASLAVASSWFALRIRKVATLNPEDWLASDYDTLLQDPLKYRRFQLKSQVLIYNRQDEINCIKAVHIHRAQNSLVVAVALICGALLVPRVLPLLFALVF